MKPILVSLLPAVIFFSSTVLNAASHRPDSNFCLEVEGKIKTEGPAGKYKVELLSQNHVIDSEEKNGRKKFHLYLQPGEYYTLRISKPGFLSRLVCIDTRSCTLQADLDLYLFSFETELIPDSPLNNINSDLADYPIAIVYFDQKQQRFKYNKEYTANLKRELYQSASK